MKSLEIRKSLTNLSGNPEILVKIFVISEIPEISYAILGSEMPLGHDHIELLQSEVSHDHFSIISSELSSDHFSIIAKRR